MQPVDERYDGILIKMIEDCKGYEGFFDLVFSMLRRKTDFFTNRQIAEKIIAETGKKHIGLFMEEAQKKEKEKEKTMTRKERKRKQQAEINKKRQKAQEEINKQRQAEKLAKEQAKAHEERKNNPNLPKFKVTGKAKPNNRNGADTENYNWGQTLDTVDISIPMDKSVRVKDLEIVLGVKKVRVAMKDGSKVFIDGEWEENINSEDSFWTMETEEGQKVVSMSLTKMPNQDKWWESLIKGGLKIDTGKVNPEPSKLSDLDGDMRGEVEKMMFDMRQKQMGKPSSEELKKKEMLEKIMKANPNLNFDLSKAKFN